MDQFKLHFESKWKIETETETKTETKHVYDIGVFEKENRSYLFSWSMSTQLYIVIMDVGALGTMIMGLGDAFLRRASGVAGVDAATAAFVASGFAVCAPRYELIVLMPKSVTRKFSKNKSWLVNRRKLNTVTISLYWKNLISAFWK